MFSSKLSVAFLIVLLLLSISHCRGQQASLSKLKLPPVISDHMVLQNGQADPVWGSAVAGTPITVEFVDPQNKTLASAQAVTGADGKWLAKIPPLQTGATGEIHIRAGTEAPVVIHDVLVGEAWLCSGQSNMSYSFKAPNMHPDWFAQAQQEATDAQVPSVTMEAMAAPAHGRSARPTRSETVPPLPGISAWPLHDKLHCPVGLIVAACPGTPVESWMPRTALDNDPVGQAVEKRYDVVAAPFPTSPKLTGPLTPRGSRPTPRPSSRRKTKARVRKIPAIRPWSPGATPAGSNGSSPTASKAPSGSRPMVTWRPTMWANPRNTAT